MYKENAAASASSRSLDHHSVPVLMYARSRNTAAPCMPLDVNSRQNEQGEGLRKGGYNKSLTDSILILNRWALEFHTPPFSELHK